MFFFICLSLLISYLVQTHHRFETLIMSIWSEYLGIVCIMISLILMLIQKLSLSIRYDLFCCGVLLVWISTWPPHFNEDSPVIFFYPLFFCFMTAILNIFCVQQASKIDALSLSYLKQFTENRFFHSGLLIAGVLVSLTLTSGDNYLLFPNMMALLILKFTLLSILEQTQA